MKSQKFAPFLISAFLLVLLHAPFNLAQDIESIEMPYYYPLNMAYSDIKFYKLDISQRQEDLDVSLSALQNGGSAPKMYVSKNEVNQYPRGPDTSDVFSSSPSGNIIFIASKDLVGVQNLYVGLACSDSKCESAVSFEYTKEIFARADGNKLIETATSLKGASTAVVRLDIPETPKAKRIVIHVDAIPSADQEKDPRLDVFINAGEKIPFTSQAVDIPRTSWFEGKTIVIYQNTELFCTGCNYTLSLKFDRYSSISFEAHVFEVDAVLGNNAILDGVRADRFNTYSFLVPEERKDEDLVFDVKPQQGKVKLYINCDSRPESLMSYYWSYEIDKPKEVIMTTREHTNCKTNNYYVAVWSRMDSVYSIKLTTKKSSKLFVGKDAPIVGDIFPDETISYEVFMPLFAAEQILFELKAEANLNALDLKLINCRFPTDCPGLLPAGVEFRHQIDNETAGTYEPPEFRYDLDEYPNSKQITINPHEEGCYPIIIQDNEFMKDPLPVCAYKITLHSTHATPVEYSLKADSKGHQWLFIGMSKMSSVLQDEVSYFVVNVPHKDATKVNFQLTKFSGDVDIFVSRTDAYPDEANDETKFSHEGMIIFQDQPELNGTYYIGVHGRETSTFSISATVLTQNNKTEDYAQTLTVGVPQKGVILPKHEHPARFYKFELDKNENWQGTIKISVNTLRGSVLVAVNNDGKIPLPNSHMWNSTGSGQIEINSDDEYFVPKATYYIGVFVDWTVRQNLFDDITFNILYYLKEDSQGTGTEGEVPVEVNIQHFFLSPLTPFHRSIKRNEVDYYEAFILPKDKGITIHKQADAGDVDIYVSLDINNKYPDKNSYTYSTKTTFKDSIELTEEDLTQTCQAEGSRLCTFYLAVIPKGDADEVAYSLTMKRDYERAAGSQSSTVLEDGRQQQFNVPEAGKPAYFYFYGMPFNPSIITVSCPGEDIRIYANKNKTEIGSSTKPTITPPSNEQYEFTSYSEDTSSIGLAHLSVPGQFNLETTVISLAVYFKHPKSDEGVDPSTTFTILVSSQMTHIYTGKPYFGAVDAGQYQYFYLNVFKPSCTLLISMTTLNDGDPDLVVSMGRENTPTIKEHQFASISKARTELLEISELDIYPKNSMEGSWVIGVYGRTNSTFTLTVLDEDQKMVDLKADTPFETYLREDTTMYFRYYHKSADNVEIRIDQLSGKIKGYVNTLSVGDSEADVVSILANQDNTKWTMNPSKDSVLSIPIDDPQACTECLYLIALEASASSKLSITVTEGERFIKLQNGVTYTNQLKSQTSKTYLFSSTNAEEVTLSVSMKGPSLVVYASNRPDVSDTNNLWRGELTSSHPHQVLSLVKSELEENPKLKQGTSGIDSVGTGKGSFYILFENPTADGSDVSYTFTVTSKDSSPILRSGAKHMLSLEKSEATSLIYYSSNDDQVIKVNLEFSVERDTNLGEDPEFDKNLRRGVPVTAKYWAEKTTAGIGREVTVVKDDVIRDSVKSYGPVKTYYIRQGLSIDGKKGKYSFDIENPFYAPITVHATVYSTELGSLPLEQNSQHSTVLASGMSETYDVYMGLSGSWYLWAFACSSSVNAQISDNPDELGKGSALAKTLNHGQGYTHKERVDDTTTKYLLVQNTANNAEDAQFILSSKLFFEKVHYGYEPVRPPTSIRTTSQYEGINSKIVVNFDPLMIDDYENTDDIVYHIKVCPYNQEDQSGLNNFCILPEECKVQQMQYKINNQPAVEATFSRLKPSPYYVHVTADIHHYNQFVKFIPYPVQTLTINEPLIENSSNTLAIVALSIVLLALVAFICYKCYGKFQLFAEEKGGFELPNIGGRKGYGHLEDDL